MNIFDDERTIRPEGYHDIREDRRDEIGHYFTGPDGLVYRMIGYRRHDGPWMQEVLGRSTDGSRPPIRTISDAAMGRTFHHHQKCPMPGCRADDDLKFAKTYATPPFVEVTWTNAVQRINIETNEMVIESLDGKLISELLPTVLGKAIRFAEFIEFREKMLQEHKIEVSRGLPIKLCAPPLPEP